MPVQCVVARQRSGVNGVHAGRVGPVEDDPLCGQPRRQRRRGVNDLGREDGGIQRGKARVNQQARRKAQIDVGKVGGLQRAGGFAHRHNLGDAPIGLQWQLLERRPGIVKMKRRVGVGAGMLAEPHGGEVDAGALPLFEQPFGAEARVARPNGDGGIECAGNVDEHGLIILEAGSLQGETRRRTPFISGYRRERMAHRSGKSGRMVEAR